MFKYEESIEVNHNISKAYNLVANVTDYPNFIPWCSKAELLKVDEENYYYYKIAVKFGLFSQDFISKDKFYANEKIEIELVEGPFKTLNSTWEFKELEPNKTLIKFYIEFEFKSIMLSKMLGKVFLDANKKVLKSFLEELNKQKEIS